MGDGNKTDDLNLMSSASRRALKFLSRETVAASFSTEKVIEDSFSIISAGTISLPSIASKTFFLNSSNVFIRFTKFLYLNMEQ